MKMKFLSLILAIYPLFSATVVGIYLPKEGGKAVGVKINLGKFQTETKKGGIFWFRNIPRGEYIIYVKGEETGKVKVNRENVELWIDEEEGQIYLTGSREFFRKEKAFKGKREVKDELLLNPGIEGYGEKLTLSLFPPNGRYYVKGTKTFLDVLDFFPYSSVENLSVGRGFPAGQVKFALYSERAERALSFSAGAYFLKSEKRESSMNLKPSSDFDAVLGLKKGNLNFYLSVQRRDEKFRSPENESRSYKKFYLSGEFPYGEAFILWGRENFDNLRDSVGEPLERGWNGKRDYRLYGLNLSYKSLSLSTSYSSLKNNLEPNSTAPSFYDSSEYSHKGGNFKEDYSSSMFHIKFSSLPYSGSFLRTNNFFNFGGEFSKRNLRRKREFPLGFLSFEGTPSFAVLRTNDTADYSLYKSSLWIIDTITSGNINFNFSVGYEGEWFTVNPSSAPAVNFPYSSEGGIPEINIESPPTKSLHLFSGKAGLSYDAFRNGYLVVRLYSAFRMAPLPIYVVKKAASTSAYTKYQWMDDGDGIPEDGEFKFLFTHMPQSLVDGAKLYSDYLEPQRYYELGAGISSSLPLGVSIDVDFLYRQTTRPFSEFWYVKDKEGWGLFTGGDWEKGGNFPNQYGGMGWYQLTDGKCFYGYTQTTNRNNYETGYKELRIDLRKSGRLGMRSELVLRSFKLNMDPTLSPFDPGNVLFTRGFPYGYPVNGEYLSPYLNSRWAFLFQMNWSPREDLMVYSLFKANDGYIIPAYYIDTSALRNGIYDYPRGYVAPLGEFRLPIQWRIDAGAEKVLNFRKFKLEISLYVMNLTNNKAALEEYEDAALPVFLQPRIFNEPRFFRIGLKIRR